MESSYLPLENKINSKKAPILWCCGQTRTFWLLCIGFWTLLLLIFLVIVFSFNSIDNQCQCQIIESIPRHTNIHSNYMKISTALGLLFDNAKQSIDIGSYYWSMRFGVPEMGGGEGEMVFNKLVNAARRGVKIRIIMNQPSSEQPANDTIYLDEHHYAEIVVLRFGSFQHNQGIMHAKFVVVDNGKRGYIGSANFDWRSYTQVKEIGMLFQYCPPLMDDLQRIFDTFWLVANIPGPIPIVPPPGGYPHSLDAITNNTFHVRMFYKHQHIGISYLASSPPTLSTSGRTDDVNSIIYAIINAKEYIYISVMDYENAYIYQGLKTWNVIQNFLISAAIRGLDVRILHSKWVNTFNSSLINLKELSDTCLDKFSCLSPGNIQVKLYIVPEDPYGFYPFTRVQHDKYMVTDNEIWMGTSNWSADYFIYTGGVSFIAQSNFLRSRLKDIFERDWYSEYSHDLEEFL